MALLSVHVRHVPTGQVLQGAMMLSLVCKIRQRRQVRHACWLRRCHLRSLCTWLLCIAPALTRPAVSGEGWEVAVQPANSLFCLPF